MAESKAETRVRQLEVVQSSASTELEYLKKMVEDQRKALLEADRLTNELRQQNALLHQKLDEQVKRIEKWDARFWGLIIVLFSAVLSLSSGLVVLLNRK